MLSKGLPYGCHRVAIHLCCGYPAYSASSDSGRAAACTLARGGGRCPPARPPRPLPSAGTLWGSAVSAPLLYHMLSVAPACSATAGHAASSCCEHMRPSGPPGRVKAAGRVPRFRLRGAAGGQACAGAERGAARARARPLRARSGCVVVGRAGARRAPAPAGRARRAGVEQ